MKRITTLLIFALAVIFSGVGVTSHAAEDLKVGVVDLKRCIDQSKIGRTKKEELRVKIESIDEEIMKLRDKAVTITQDVERQQLLMSETLKQEKKKEFEELQEAAMKLQDKKREVADELTKSVLGDIGKIIQGYADEKGFDMILNDGAQWLLYYGKRLDITDEVVKRYDEMAGK